LFDSRPPAISIAWAGAFPSPSQENVNDDEIAVVAPAKICFQRLPNEVIQIIAANTYDVLCKYTFPAIVCNMLSMNNIGDIISD
jgi:hypothetical protein